MIICAGKNEVFNFAQPMGVGLIEMAINLTRLCLFNKPDFLLLLEVLVHMESIIFLIL